MPDEEDNRPTNRDLGLEQHIRATMRGLSNRWSPALQSAIEEMPREAKQHLLWALMDAEQAIARERRQARMGMIR